MSLMVKAQFSAQSTGVPSNGAIENFERIVAPMDAAIRNNYDEICRLQEIRDSLLPKLMSGEIDVSNIQL